jgi:hypothetical protein
MTLVTVLAIWLVLSLPLAVLVGKCCALGGREDAAQRNERNPK